MRRSVIRARWFRAMACGAMAATLVGSVHAAEAELAAPSEAPGDDASAAPGGWTQGPARGQLGQLAEIAVPAGYVFADAAATRVTLERMQNPVSGTELGFLAPAEGNWFVVFEFDDIGHVADADKETLDADAILASIRAGTEKGNELRRERGWETLEVLDWARPPSYNEATHNLEWATRAKSSSGGISVNYNTRLLGRGGVMSATLVVDPQELEATLPSFAELLAGYGFVGGQRYSEFLPGDKIAKYGLTGLITGGAAAVLIKTGLLQKLWKPIALGLGALVLGLRKLFRRKPADPGAVQG